jgi:hypothetical protein
VTSEELAREVRDIVLLCSARIVNEGRDQYEQELCGIKIQEFETATDSEMEQMILEEIEDTINHLVMLHIRVRRINEEANRHAERARDAEAEFRRTR